MKLRVIALLLIFSSSYRMPAFAAELRHVVNSATLNPASDSPPATDISEYQPYFKSGNNVLKVEMQVHFDDGSNQLSNGNIDDVMLYPKTAYTEWMIRPYIQGSVGKPEAYGRGFPGDPGFGPQAPDYLSFVSKDSVVRSAKCDRGWATFIGLPPGTYIAVGEVSKCVAYSGSVTSLQPGIAYNPGTGLYEGTMTNQNDGYGRQAVSFGHYLMVWESYTFASGAAKTAIERKVYSFGECP